MLQKFYPGCSILAGVVEMLRRVGLPLSPAPTRAMVSPPGRGSCLHFSPLPSPNPVVQKLFQVDTAKRTADYFHPQPSLLGWTQCSICTLKVLGAMISFTPADSNVGGFTQGEENWEYQGLPPSPGAQLESGSFTLEPQCPALVLSKAACMWWGQRLPPLHLGTNFIWNIAWRTPSLRTLLKTKEILVESN